ncbi:hypothetical protein [Streptomyces zhihengii]|uniref:hypothetical protein n=1 Tax=Streptomyces zhihengii TaxID=1818004 RepID=UPI0033AC4503
MRRLGWIAPVAFGRVRLGTSGAGTVTVPRFAAGHIDELPAAHPDVDWEQLRTIRAGRPSPLRGAPSGQRVGSVRGGMGPGG